MTSNEQRLIQALHALAAAETRTPSPDLESRLLRTLHSRKMRWRWPAAITALAAAGILTAIFRPAPDARVVEPAPFMRIPYSEPLAPTDRTELVQVTMPVAQLLSWGFPYSGSDPNVDVNAEVLVGEDGLARAIRLVQ